MLCGWKFAAYQSRASRSFASRLASYSFNIKLTCSIVAPLMASSLGFTSDFCLQPFSSFATSTPLPSAHLPTVLPPPSLQHLPSMLDTFATALSALSAVLQPTSAPFHARVPSPSRLPCDALP